MKQAWSLGIPMANNNSVHLPWFCFTEIICVIERALFVFKTHLLLLPCLFLQYPILCYYDATHFFCLVRVLYDHQRALWTSVSKTLHYNLLYIFSMYNKYPKVEFSFHFPYLYMNVVHVVKGCHCPPLFSKTKPLTVTRSSRVSSTSYSEDKCFT